MRTKTKHSGKRIALIIILAALILCAGGCFLYLNDYYRADAEVNEYFEKSGGVAISCISDGLYLDGPGTENALIFYPGAKVEYTAYIPLAYKLAERGIDVFIIKMPCNVAVLGMNKADDILSEYDYEHMYIGGHSLGGAVAAIYAANHADSADLDGLILLGAYPTKSLASSGMSVLTIYGSEDKVLEMEKVESGRSLLPENATETIITGGNHAQFGCYGEQKGDSTALISAEEQWERTTEEIINMIDAE
jgi:dienelactone hydrolase